MPHLRRQGSAIQLVVDGEPFLILGGELHNSSASSLEYMAPIWPRMAAANLNTLIVPLSWELVEPEEGVFEFGLVDGLIDSARRHGLRIVLLWLASWKNGMSSYAPLWVKKDTKRFARARRADGTAVEVISTLCNAACEADARAFATLMRHIREVDGDTGTVLMMQVENEVGLMGDARDRSSEADAAYAGPVPDELIRRLREGALRELDASWKAAGARESGSWAELFGEGARSEELFMAWNYARYIDRVTAAGKAEYPIPMYTNAWLEGEGEQPGKYPTGTPSYHLLDVWQVGAPNLDFLAPDIYAANFAERCRRYHRAGNPLFIPEMSNNEVGARNVFYAIGNHDAIGVSPFAIDGPAELPVAKSYALLSQLAPTILEHQGFGRTAGFLLDESTPTTVFELGGLEVEVSLDAIFGYSATSGYGLIVAVGEGEFYGVGCGVGIRFKPIGGGRSKIGIGFVDEGEFVHGEWRPGRRLNGDENDQGQAWRFPIQRLSISRCTTYRYE